MSEQVQSEAGGGSAGQAGHSPADVPGTERGAPKPGGVGPCGCGCGAAPNGFVYAIGKLEVRFPTMGVERECRQLERQLSGAAASEARTERLGKVLRDNPHLARQVCYVLAVGGIPAYVVIPTATDVLDALVDGVARAGDPEVYTLLLGRHGPVTQPTQCAGVIAPLVGCDKAYTFVIDEWAKGLERTVGLALKDRAIEPKSFTRRCREQFQHFIGVENMGATDAHRAINFMLMRHPGLALAALERPNSILDQIESRVATDIDVRRVVLLVFVFIDRATGVPERLFCRIDVTDEFPFVVDGPGTAAPPLGLLPFVDQRDSALI